MDIEIIYKSFRDGKLQRNRILSNCELLALRIWGETDTEKIPGPGGPEIRTSPKRWSTRSPATTTGGEVLPRYRATILRFSGPSDPQVSRGQLSS